MQYNAFLHAPKGRGLCTPVIRPGAILLYTLYSVLHWDEGHDVQHADLFISALVIVTHVS